MKIRVGDIVKVQRGKDAGRSSVVEKVYPKTGKILIKGVNEVKRHLKVNDKGEGGIVTVNRPLDVSKVMVVCPECGKTTRVGFKLTDGKKSRYCKKCLKSIDKVKGEKSKDKIDGKKKVAKKVEVKKKDKINKEKKV